MEISEAQLREILQRCENTTNGPWKSFIEGRDHTCGSDFIKTAKDDIESLGATKADQDFIANAKQDIPMLVKTIAKLKGWTI